MFSKRLPEKGACTPEKAGLFTTKADSYTEHSPTSRIGSDTRRRRALRRFSVSSPIFADPQLA